MAEAAGDATAHERIGGATRRRWLAAGVVAIDSDLEFRSQNISINDCGALTLKTVERLARHHTDTPLTQRTPAFVIEQ